MGLYILESKLPLLRRPYRERELGLGLCGGGITDELRQGTHKRRSDQRAHHVLIYLPMFYIQL